MKNSVGPIDSMAHSLSHSAWLQTRIAWLLIGALACLLLSSVGNTASAAGEVVMSFRRDPRCQSQVVKLGDLVEIVSGANQLDRDVLELPLAPAPRSSARQDWTAADVMRHLELRGVNRNVIRWSGPESTVLTRLDPVANEPGMRTMTPAFVQQQTLNQSRANVIQAIREYIWLQTGERTDWRIALDVPTDHAQGLYVRRNIEAIGGGAAPWEGQHEFTLSYKHQGKSYQCKLKATVTLPPMVVTTTRALRKDEVLDASMLQYSPLSEKMAPQRDEFFSDINELVGKQLRKSYPTGQPILRSTLGAPTIVTNGELVSIEALAGSVSVKTGGRALGSGAVGDAIAVEVLPSRNKLTAIVVGPRQVRIAAQPEQAVSTPQQPALAPASGVDRTAQSSTPEITRLR